MRITSNLLYLLLLYAVLDKGNRLSVTTGLLAAVGIMLFGLCCNNPIFVCGNTPRNNSCCGRRFSDDSLPFIITNGL